MAGIDKTYTNSYKDYIEFRDWAKKQFVTFFDGYRECVGNYVYQHWKEEDFDGTERPIMNTPTWVDIYLIQNCKFDFVLERMKEVYSEKNIEKYKEYNLSLPPSNDYKKNRKIVIKKHERTTFPIHSQPYGKMKEWWIQSESRYYYNDKNKVWVNNEMEYPHNTNTSHIRSLKSIVRHLRKQYLKKGDKFVITGRYVGEIYEVIAK
jgi:hypothetical protein